MLERHQSCPVCSVVVVALAVGTGAAGADETFLRGDVNNDGVVSIADCLALYLFVNQEDHRGPRPSCMEAADIDDSGLVDIGDFRHLTRTLFTNQFAESYSTIPAPFPRPGADPTDDDLDCASRDGAGALDDPAAEVEVLDAVVPGGDQSTAGIKVRISNSLLVGGYSGVLSALDAPEESIFWYVPAEYIVDGTYRKRETAYAGVDAVDGKIHFGTVHTGFLNARRTDPTRGVLAPATDHMVLKILVCLRPGTPAGAYPLTLETAELVDFETRRRIPARPVSATLTVLEDVSEAWLCERADFAPPSGPEDVRAAFSVGTEGLERGARQELPVVVRANVPIEGFTFSIEYWRNLRLTGVRPAVPGGEEWSLFTHTINGPLPPPPFSSGRNFVTVFAEFGSPDRFLEANTDHVVLALEFEATADAETGFSQVSFSERGQVDGDHVQNRIRAFGQDVGPRLVTRWDTEWGGLFIGASSNNDFLRGDVNLDGRVTISDALMLRRFFFIGGLDDLPCENAGDVDDDGFLNLADSVTVLEHLFNLPLGEGLIPAPYPEPGPDVTIDPRPCFAYTVTPPATTDGLIRLGTIEAGPGEEVEVPIFISSKVAVDGFQLLVAYDPTRFAPTAGDLVYTGTIYHNPVTLAPGLGPGGAGYAAVRPHPEEGFLTVGFVAHLTRSDFDIPSGDDVLVGKIHGRIPGDAPLGTVRLHLVDRDPSDVSPKHLRSELTVEGAARFVSLVPKLEDGFLQIVGDLTFFTRGDANADERVDISDPIFTLNHLFLDGAAPVCPDAADADDSGRIDITDAIVTLDFLFRGGSATIAFPYLNRGRDPTPDSLGPCRSE